MGPFKGEWYRRGMQCDAESEVWVLSTHCWEDGHQAQVHGVYADLDLVLAEVQRRQAAGARWVDETQDADAHWWTCNGGSTVLVAERFSVQAAPPG